MRQQERAAQSDSDQHSYYAARLKAEYEAWRLGRADSHQPPAIAQRHRKPSGLGQQIDAMINTLRQSGHSNENIARVMRLRADKLGAGE